MRVLPRLLAPIAFASSASILCSRSSAIGPSAVAPSAVVSPASPFLQSLLLSSLLRSSVQMDARAKAF